MLVDSVASSHHGARRATQDIDIVGDSTFTSLDAFLGSMQGDDVHFDADVAQDEFKRHGQFNVIDGSTAWKVDVIFRKPRAFKTPSLRNVSKTGPYGHGGTMLDPKAVLSMYQKAGLMSDDPAAVGTTEVWVATFAETHIDAVVQFLQTPEPTP